MPLTRHPNDTNQLIDLTRAIQVIPNTSSVIKDMGLFMTEYTDQESVLFDKITASSALLPATNRRAGEPTYGKDRDVVPYSLPLGYFKHMDRLTKQDIMGKRRAGSNNEQETFENALRIKLEDMNRNIDYTHEYMMVQAIKGNCVTPDGGSLADMFTLFGQTQVEVDFLLGTATTNVRAKCAAVRDAIQANLQDGGSIIGDVDVLVDRSFFNKFTDHAEVKNAYLNSASNTRYQRFDQTVLPFGISEQFSFHGLNFMVYEFTFTLPSGSTEKAIDADSGHAVPRTTTGDLYRGVYGPSQKLDTNGGSEKFASAMYDRWGMAYDIMIETAPLFYVTRPLAMVKVITSN